MYINIENNEELKQHLPKQGNAVAWGIIAETFRCGLEPPDEKLRKTTTAYQLVKESLAGMSEFKAGLMASRTRQFSDAMTIPKDLIAKVLLAAGDRSGSSTGVAVPAVNLPTGTA